LIEGRRFSERDFIDSFISGLKGEIKPFVLIFKPEMLDSALEHALYIESATDSQFKRLRSAIRFTPSNHSPSKFPDKGQPQGYKGTTGGVNQKDTLL
jgi:hypothetical protein